MMEIIALSAWLLVGALVGTLATWRVTVWLYMDKGVFNLMGRWRERVTSGWLLDQFSCFWCLSSWAALLVAPWVIVWPLLLPLAMSGAVILLAQGGRIVWRAMEQ